jgi:predicted dehydrogenase
MKKYNWAILGCGKIAKKFSKDLATLNNANLFAVASRNLEKAKKFAKEFNFLNAFGSYDELVNTSEVDIVYIATPHSLHSKHTILCLKNKKAVLCEKAFAMNLKEVNQMVNESNINNTFLMEAFWTRLNPQFLKIQKLIKSSKLGKIRFVKSDFMFNADYNPKNRLYNVDLGGSSLMDIGIYPVFYSLMFLGIPNKIKTLITFSETDSEESIAILMGYKDETFAVLTSSFDAISKNETELCFENGFIKFERNKTIHLNCDGRNQFIEIEEDQNFGFQHEAKHVMNCLNKKLTQSPILSHEFSKNLISILDKIRKESNIVFTNHD